MMPAMALPPLQRAHRLLSEAARELGDAAGAADLAHLTARLDRPSDALPKLRAALDRLDPAPQGDARKLLEAALVSAGTCARDRSASIIERFNVGRARVKLRVSTTPIVHIAIVRDLCSMIARDVPPLLRDGLVPTIDELLQGPIPSDERSRTREASMRLLHAAARAALEPLREEPPMPPYDHSEPEWTEAQERDLLAWCRSELPGRAEALWSGARPLLRRTLHFIISDAWENPVARKLAQAQELLDQVSSALS